MNISDNAYKCLICLYESSVDIHKFYWNIALKLVFSVYSSSGIAFAFYVNNINYKNILYIPLIMTFMFCILCYIGVVLLTYSEEWIQGYAARMLQEIWNYEEEVDRLNEQKGLEPYYKNQSIFKYYFVPNRDIFQIFLIVSGIGSFGIFCVVLYFLFPSLNIPVLEISITSWQIICFILLLLILSSRRLHNEVKARLLVRE